MIKNTGYAQKIIDLAINRDAYFEISTCDGTYNVSISYSEIGGKVGGPPAFSSNFHIKRCYDFKDGYQRIIEFIKDIDPSFKETKE